MSKESKTEQLFDLFPPIPTGEWMEKIKTDLKGADFNKKLVWRSQEGFEVMPFYRQEDLKGLEHLDCNPGEYPFVRGNKAENNDWLIRQDINVNDAQSANKKALEILNKGVESIGFVIADSTKLDESFFKTLLNNICLEAIEVNFVAAHQAIEVAKLFINYLKSGNEDISKIRASIDFDPIGHFALYGKFCEEENVLFKKAAGLVKTTEEGKDIRPITIHGNYFKNAGVNIPQELAVTLAIGSEYLAKLSDEGINAEDANQNIRFHFGVGTNYFMEIAKFRAARFLWAQITKKYGIEKQNCKMHAHAQTSTWSMSIYDPYVNTLRTTTEAMSATLGGVESLTVDPFNNFYESPTAQSERIARNQQIILKEESYFKNVIDPAGGSYYIEVLTDKLIKEAWEIFLGFEEDGGFIASYKTGKFQDKLNESVKKRNEAIALRKEKFLGTNEFPNFNETKEDKQAELFEAKDYTAADAVTKGLTTYRGPMEFERLRNRTDVYAKTNKRPSAFMLTYGNLAMRLARSQFSQNFFAIGGFNVIDNHGFETIEDGINEAIKQNADVIVLCSSDDEYAAIAPKAKELINGKAEIVVAGYPKDCIEELKANGIEHFIHIKSNVLETLEKFQQKIGLL